MKGRISIKSLNIYIANRGRRVTDHEIGIVDTKRTYTLPGLLKNRSRARIGDSVVLPAFTVQEMTVKGNNPMEFKEQSVKDTATVCDIRDGKLYLVFEHGLFKSAIDNNNTNEWGKTQLCYYLEHPFLEAMNDAGIPAKGINLLSKDEIFGENRIQFFNRGKNRIAFSKDERQSVLYWLRTPVDETRWFCVVDDYGDSNYHSASLASIFVRPCFVIE